MFVRYAPKNPGKDLSQNSNQHFYAFPVAQTTSKLIKNMKRYSQFVFRAQFGVYHIMYLCVGWPEVEQLRRDGLNCLLIVLVNRICAHASRKENQL